jgi:hypothetical protein
MAGLLTLSPKLGSGARLLTRFVLLVASTVALMSFGGQLLLAPILVPLQWVAARFSDRNGGIVFTALASLLMAEVGWMLGYMATDHEFPSVLWALGWGAATAVLFYRTALAGPFRPGAE